jgi:glutathione synthase/RimK-type ligase-like ATP-grasp enzyme
MPALLVVDEHCRSGWQGVRAISSLDYLQGVGAELPPGTVVRNIATDYAYLSTPYYVSLIAEARGHIPFPRVIDLFTSNPEINSPNPSSALRRSPGAALLGGAKDRTIGILFTPADKYRASSRGSLRDFERSAVRLGLAVELVSRSQILNALPRLAGLFVRDLTIPGNIAFRAALAAEALGLPVIDDPTSIIHCSNKVFVHHLLERHDLPIPRTVLAGPNTSGAEIIRQLGLPLVLKVPDGSFSLGVYRAKDAAEVDRILAAIRLRSAVVIAQEFMPTDYDWRIGILAGEPLFACRYFMAPGHWQMVHHISPDARVEGETAAVPLENVPPFVLETARRAGALVGDGLYGVDIKQQGTRACVIEVNDNPDIDSDFEAALPNSSVWPRLADWFATKLRTSESRFGTERQMDDETPVASVA